MSYVLSNQTTSILTVFTHLAYCHKHHSFFVDINAFVLILESAKREIKNIKQPRETREEC